MGPTVLVRAALLLVLHLHVITATVITPQALQRMLKQSSFAANDTSRIAQDSIRTADTCTYPCILQHGCVCDHEKPFLNKDLQFYGTCTSCDEGWTGNTCGTVSQDCVNGGVKVKNAAGESVCNCTPTWEDPECGTQRCLHSVRGDIKNNNFCTACEENWRGISCDMCTTDAQCPNETICDTSMVAFSTKKRLFCNLTDKTWLDLFSDNRNGTEGRIVIDWVNPQPWNVALEEGTSEGEGYASLWRVEPHREWLDPFFYCSIKSCSMSVTTQRVEPERDEIPESADDVRWALSGIMYFILLLLVGNGFLGSLYNTSSKVRARNFAVLSVLLVAFLVVFILFSCLFGHEKKIAGKMETFVTYECEHSGCKCAQDPPLRKFWPFCINSTFQDYFLPTLVGKSKTVCNIDTAACYFTHENLAWQRINLQCWASECRLPNKTVTPTTVTTQAAASAATTAGGIFAGAIALLLAHYAWSMFIASQNHREFRKIYQESVVTSADSVLRKQSPSRKNIAAGLDTLNAEDGAAAGQPLLLDDGRNGAARPSSRDYGGKGATKIDATVMSVTSEDQEMDTWISLTDGSYDVNGKQILRDVNMSVKSGEMLAVVGPSGAGKTTLLDILTRRNKSGKCGGVMRINGQRIDGDNDAEWAYKRMIGYVAQEENLIAALTVRQSIRFAAKLKLPAGIPDSVIDQLVEDTIEKMHLVSCADTLVGNDLQRGISGGEKRRVSIATELVANPRVLFLDEVTSGLDSLSAHDVMRAIVNLTRKTSVSGFRRFFSFRPAVVFSIHQPSHDIYQMFDRVMLLSRGSMLYFGPADLALRHIGDVCGVVEEGDNAVPVSSNLRNVGLGEESGSRESNGPCQHARESGMTLAKNPAEVLLRLQHTLDADQFAALVARPSPQSQIDHDSSAPGSPLMRDECDGNGEIDAAFGGFSVIRDTMEKQRFYPNVWEQFILLSKRSWASLMGSYYLVMCHSAAVIFLGLTLSFLYRNTGLDLFGVEDKAGMVTFFLLIMSFSSLSCLDLFIGEKKLFAVERENGYYQTLPYFATKVLFDFVPLRIMPTMILSSVIYFPMGLRTDEASYFLWFVACSTLFSMYVTAMCLIIAILCPTFGAAALFSSLMILWNTAFGGLMIQTASIPKVFTPFRYTSPFYYAYEAIMIDILNGLGCVFDPNNSEGQPEGVRVPIPCKQMLVNLGLNPNMFRRDITALIAGTFASLVFGLLLLWAIRWKK